jgi:hypothetical protein
MYYSLSGVGGLGVFEGALVVFEGALVAVGVVAVGVVGPVVH